MSQPYKEILAVCQLLSAATCYQVVPCQQYNGIVFLQPLKEHLMVYLEGPSRLILPEPIMKIK